MTNTQKISESLTALRDETRVQIHLMSMDARLRWQELETKIAALETKLDQGGGKLSDTLAAIEHDLEAKVKEFLKTQIKTGAPLI